MKKDYQWGGLVWLGLGTGFLIGSVKLKAGSLHNPGAGFIPLIVGILLMILGLAMFLPGLLAKSREKDASRPEFGRGSLKRLLLPFATLMTLFGYILLLEPLGFLPSTFLFLFLLFKISEPQKRMMPIVLSLSTAILSYLLFSVLLQGQFPRGILGF